MLAGWCFKPSHRHGASGLPLWSQPIGHQRVSATVAALAQLSQQYASIPDPRSQPFFQVWFERIELAGYRWPRSINRHVIWPQSVLAYCFPVVARQLADRPNAQSLRFQLFELSRRRFPLTDLGTPLCRVGTGF